MSMAAVSWAYAQRLRHGPKSVLLNLAWHSDANREAWPGVSTIAAEVGLEERQVGRNLEVLIELGLIERRRRHYRSKRRADVFKLNFEPGVPDTMSDNPASSIADTMSDSAALADRHSDSSYPTSAQVVSDILSPPIEEPNSEPKERTQDSILDDQSQDGEPKKKQRKTKKNLTTVPDDWPGVLLETEAIAFWQSKHRHDLAETVEHHAAQARDHHLAKGSRFADWNAAWRTWYRNAVRFNRERAVASSRGSSSAYVDAVRELAEEFDAE